MKIEERKVTVREVTEGYFNDAEEGVVGYDGRLDIRPKYQREFVYKDAQRNEVIRTVMKGLPLNVMYWVDRGEELKYWTVNRGLFPFVSMWMVISLWMTSISIICPAISRQNFLITNYLYMSATAPTVKSWTGSASSTLREKN